MGYRTLKLYTIKGGTKFFFELRYPGPVKKLQSDTIKKKNNNNNNNNVGHYSQTDGGYIGITP